MWKQKSPWGQNIHLPEHQGPNDAHLDCSNSLAQVCQARVGPSASAKKHAGCPVEFVWPHIAWDMLISRNNSLFTWNVNFPGNPVFDLTSEPRVTVCPACFNQEVWKEGGLGLHPGTVRRTCCLWRGFPLGFHSSVFFGIVWAARSLLVTRWHYRVGHGGGSRPT